MAWRRASSSTLKIAAIIGMTCNHAAWIFSEQLPFPIYCMLEGLGGITFPIMAFLVAEGWRHTSNCRRYLIRLALFALVSQIPFWLFLDHTLNVMFTLLIGLSLLHLHETMDGKPAWAILAIAGIAASAICDWGIIGIPMILLAGLLPTRKEQALCSSLLPCATFGIPAILSLAAGDWEAMPSLLYAGGNALAGGLLCLYNGARGLSLKWFFYLYYPAHITVLGIAHLILF